MTEGTKAKFWKGDHVTPVVEPRIGEEGLFSHYEGPNRCWVQFGDGFKAEYPEHQLKRVETTAS